MVVSVKSQQVKLRKPVSGYKKRINYKLFLIPIAIIALYKLVTTIPDINFNREKRVVPTEIVLPEHNLSINKDSADYTAFSSRLYKEHRVSEIDKLSTISIKYDLSLSTILNVNNIRRLKDFTPGMTIKIPDRDGFIYNIKDGDTLETISSRFNLTKENLFSVNRLKSYSIKGLDTLFIPGEHKYNIEALSKAFIYPVKGYISKRFGYHTNTITGLTSLYQGVDISPTNNNNIYSSKAGVISSIGYNANYGNYIFIDHWGGFRSLYAHMDSINVEVGDRVEQGEILGIVGETGFTIKRKLFFCLLKDGKPVDPEKLLN